MTKKLILGAVLGLIAVAGLKATKWFGYAKTEAHAWSEWADDQVPVEKKIAALRGDVAALDRDVEGTKNLLAKAIVDTRELSTDAAKLRASLETDRKALLARGQKLKDGTEQVAVNKVDLADQKAKLDADVKSFDRRKHSLENMETSLAFHERNRDVLQKQLETLVAQKLELQSAIDAFEVEYKTVQLQQMESKYQTDDTRLSQIKATLRDMRKKLDVEREKLKLTPRTTAEYQAANTKSVDEILAPLGEKPAKIEAARE